MRILPGIPDFLANQSIDSLSLMKYAISEPDIIPTVFELFRRDYTPLTTLLNVKGMKTKGLSSGTPVEGYRLVKANVIEYAVKHADRVKQRFVLNDNNVSFQCDAYPTMPGYKQSVIYVWLDNDWAGPKEVIELADNRTLLYNIDDQSPVLDGQGYRYMTKLITKDPEEYCDIGLLQEGSECRSSMTMYEHDFSTGGNEKQTFDGWARSYMTLQRLGYSHSGTAAAMKASRVWTVHNGDKYTFLEKVEFDMLQRAAEYHEYQCIFGKGTVSSDGEVLMKDKQGREILAGDGLLNAGDGAYEYPYQGWTIKFLETLLKDSNVRSGKEGKLEVALVCGMECYLDFATLMREKGFVTMNNNVVGDAEKKGINNDYSYYEIGGVRLIPTQSRYFDDPTRPGKLLPNVGVSGSWEGIIVPLGLTDGGANSVETVGLRPMKRGTVSGIDKGGEMASDVDGSFHKILFQTGIISRAKIAHLFRPIF